MARHITKCLLAGIVTLLPVGALVLIIYKLNDAIDPMLSGLPWFPGRGLVGGIVVIYLLGLLVSTVVGQWFLGFFDRAIGRVAGLASMYSTVKQILGYGSGKDAMFHGVVLIKDDACGTLELGLLTEVVHIEDGLARNIVFVPGSPNPTTGRMLLVEPERCVPTNIAVDAAFKALVSTGKTGLR